MVKNIALIGAGQLGSRHLQALSRLSFQANIQVVDPSQSSLDLAKSRFNEMPKNFNIKNVSYWPSIFNLENQIDVAIIATNADIRADVIRQLVAHRRVGAFILEKILFQKLDDYLSIQLLLEKHHIKAWVNHPRRTFPYYLELADQLAGSQKITIEVRGGGWGLCCNGLHYIDTLAFLTGAYDLKISVSELNPEIVPSKRSGYLEANGALIGSVGQHPLLLVCDESDQSTLIKISTDNRELIIDEENEVITFTAREFGWRKIKEKRKIIYFQSELTDSYVKDIIEGGGCDLPTYGDATKLHIPFLKAMLMHFNKYSSEKYTYCPIT